jgi:hypothetical protein
MSQLPSFIPSKLNLSGDWNKDVPVLYNVFKHDFIGKNILFKNLKLIYDKRLTHDNKEECFWHLVTADHQSSTYIPDYKRAERLPWAKPIIDNYQKVEIKAWDYREGSSNVRIYLWLENYDYAVILEKQTRKRSNLIVLITAFYVETWKKRDLLRRYRLRINPSA